MALYRTKPRMIQAERVITLIKKALCAPEELPEWFRSVFARGGVTIRGEEICIHLRSTYHQVVGPMDYVACNEDGSLRGVECEQFEKTYQLAEAQG